MTSGKKSGTAAIADRPVFQMQNHFALRFGISTNSSSGKIEDAEELKHHYENTTSCNNPMENKQV